MKSLLLLLLAPFIAATGFFPSRRLPRQYGPTFKLFSVLYVAVSYYHLLWYSDKPITPGRIAGVTVMTAFFYWLAVITLKPRWRIAMLMAWVGTDLILFTVGLYSFYWDMALLVIYFVRSALDDDPKAAT